jgi:hypothetical protein
MSGTGVALEVGPSAAGQALLIVAMTVMPVCLTVIALVLLVEPNDRVKAIKELAPVLFFTRASVRRRMECDARSSSSSRPGRRVLVIDDLDDLRGPVEGRAELPLRLFWSLPGHLFDLGDRDSRLWYYQTVLREASRADDLTRHLDAATLIALWPDLYLPRGVRRGWEEQHPPLHAAMSA